MSNGIVPNDFPGNVAGDFLDILEIVEKDVKPERESKKDKKAQKNWWLYLRARGELYHTIGQGQHFFNHPTGWDRNLKPMGRLLVCARVSKYLTFSWQDSRTIMSDATVVLASESSAFAAIMSSGFHNEWSWNNASRMKRDIRYTPSDCFETFPFPENFEQNEKLEMLGDNYFDLRSEIMIIENIGLTKLYNSFHDQGDTSESIMELRALLVQIDEAVALSYGWQDLSLNHDFYEVSYLSENDNIRFSICEPARIEILQRLSELNQKRFQEQEGSGQEEKKKNTIPKKKTAKKKSENLDLFD